MLLNNGHKTYTFKIVEYAKNWNAIADDWLKLFHECSQPCIFYHPIFIEAADNLESDSPTHLILGYQQEKLIFGLPIQLEKWWGLLNVITNFKGVVSDHLFPLDSTFCFNATRSFFDSMRNSKYSVLFQGSSLETGFSNLLKSISRSGRFHIFIRPLLRCPFLSLPERNDELLENFSKKFCSNLQYSLRQAEKAGIEFRILTSSNRQYTFNDAFQNLIGLHGDRFKYLDRISRFLTISQSYYEKVCEKAIPVKDIVWFTEATHKGQIIGSLFGFLTKQRFYFFQHGFSAQYKKFSIGNLLIYQTMVDLIKKKVYLFDFLRGMEDYKLKWTQTVDEDYYVILSTSLLGRMALEWLRLQRSRKRNGRLAGIRYRLLNKD